MPRKAKHNLIGLHGTSLINKQLEQNILLKKQIY